MIRAWNLGAPRDIYSEGHGEITCIVKCFENVIEMNFVLDDGVGTVVALDSEALDVQYGLVGRARQIVEEERGELSL